MRLDDKRGESTEILRDVPLVLALGEPPPLHRALADAGPLFLERAWSAARTWIDSLFFEEAGGLGGMALDEGADSLPPADDHVRVGGRCVSATAALVRAVGQRYSVVGGSAIATPAARRDAGSRVVSGTRPSHRDGRAGERARLRDGVGTGRAHGRSRR